LGGIHPVAELRVSEVIGLKVTDTDIDIDSERTIIRIQHGRTERSRMQALPKAPGNPARLVARGKAQRMALPG
jgi:hypothetical protein